MESTDKKQELRISGFGGQGIVLAGNILGKAASLFEGLHAVFTQSYGPEARGGSCSADVVIAQETIHYPRVTRPDVLVLMSEDAKNSYAACIPESKLILIDQDLVQLDEAPPGSRLFKIPATRIAEKLGRKIVANIVMLGFITAVTGTISHDAMKQAILASIPAGTEELNLKAFEEGFNYGRKHYA